MVENWSKKNKIILLPELAILIIKFSLPPVLNLLEIANQKASFKDCCFFEIEEESLKNIPIVIEKTTFKGCYFKGMGKIIDLLTFRDCWLDCNSPLMG